jgi:multicomponent Na+:H+ antiporter subunit G
MELLQDLLAWLFILAGGGLLLVGARGLIRLPDFCTRLHAGGVIDTLGAELMLVGMMFQAGLSLVTVKLFLIGAFLFFTSPTSTHAIANAAYVAGLKPYLVDGEEGGEGPNTKEPDAEEEDPSAS